MKRVLTYTKMILMAVMMLLAGNISAASADTYSSISVLASGSWAKIRVSTTGIHQLTNDVIQQAGFSDLSKVKIYGYGGNIIPDKLTASYLKEHDDLKEIATYSANGVKYFYADGPVNWSANSASKRIRNYFSDYGYYFITENDNVGLTCSEQDLYNKVTASTFSHHFLYERDKYAWYQSGRNLVDDTKITRSSPQTVNVIIPKGNTSASLYIAVTAGTTGSTFSITPGSISGTISIGSNYKCNVAVRSTNISDLSQYSTNENGDYICPVTISTTGSTVLRLDYVEASFATPASPAALGSGSYPVAEYYCNITNQNHHGDAPADLVIIIPAQQQLLASAQKLAQFHEEHDGISSIIVPADELYNEFSSGTPDFSAYKRYLKMFYDRNASTKPKNVLLFGDGVWDNRMCTLSSTYNPDNYLLCHETEDSYYLLSSFSSDDYITALDDEETIAETSSNSKLTLDIGVGRIPVTNSVEAKNVINKIKRYCTTVGEWQNELLFFADDGSSADNFSNTHMDDINANADNIISDGQGFYVKKALADSYVLESTSTGYKYPNLEALVKKMQNKGALIIDYGGHGSGTQLMDENVVTLSETKTFKGDNYSLWFTAACETVPFDQTSENIGEQLVLNKAGGAIAFYGTTRTVSASSNTIINKAFMHYVLSYGSDGKPLTMGEAQRQAKNYISQSGSIYGQDSYNNKHQYVLIGDPAISLALPRYKAVVDQINGKSTAETIDNIPGNSIVTVKGHITTIGNASVTDFNGMANLLVRDSQRTFKCRGNRHADSRLSYDDRTNILYKGTCSVRNGQFSCTFRMPSDIYNDGRTGLITVFATDSTNIVTAHGECGNFIAKGWIDSPNDSIGPAIFAYINTPSFQNGGDVSQTPFFVAEVSDNDGLSTTGMSLGHGMELAVDGSASMTYDLTDNFTYDADSYTSGQTYYTIPTLTPGKHSVTFTAWDILGNPNQTELTFNVVKNIAPDVTHISVSPNPITDMATFYVTHDQKGSEAVINIDIIDLMGRVVQTLTWTDTFSETNPTSKYTWTPSGLSRGMYLYRVRVSCNGSSDTTKSQKLILAQ